MANTAPIAKSGLVLIPEDSTFHVGHVDSLNGSVTAFRADGTAVTLEVGYPVFLGDEIVTAADSAIGVVFTDHSALSMAGNGRISIDELVYDPQNQEGSMGISFTKGVFTFLSGEIASTEPEAMVINSPVATIGIRGTQIGVDFADGENLIVVMMEEKSGFVGEAIIRNQFGVGILNSAHQATRIAGPHVGPGALYEVNKDHILEHFGTTLEYLPPIGDANLYGVEEFAKEELGAFDTAAGEAD